MKGKVSIPRSKNCCGVFYFVILKIFGSPTSKYKQLIILAIASMISFGELKELISLLAQN